MTGHGAMTSRLTSQFFFFSFFFFCTYGHAHTGTHTRAAHTATYVRARTYGPALVGTISAFFNFQEGAEEERASVYRSLVINTSKEMMCFSDFPIPRNFPNFMHHSLILQYFRLFVERFNLMKHILFKRKVTAVTKREDFTISGQWNVTVVDENGKEESTVFDAVMVCIGHHVNQHLPLDSFPGIDKFQGPYMHSREYKEPWEYKDKRVLVIGIGNSGGDIAVEVSRHAAQVYLSTRRGAWVINRISDNGYPLDIVVVRRYLNVLPIPEALINFLAERKINSQFNHTNYGLQASHRFKGQHPTVNDELSNRIINGSVIVKPNVAEFSETGAIFDDGTEVDNLDFIIFATGYSFYFPFLEVDHTLTVRGNVVSLYKNVFLPSLPQPTLAIIGLVQPWGAVMPISEMQGRWTTRIFKGATAYLHILSLKKWYVDSQRHTLQVDYITYMDEIGELIGVKPRFLPLFLRDPALALSVFFEPCTPYQYRLQGPGQWEGAAQAIRTQWDRVLAPTRTRVTTLPCQDSGIPSKLFSILSLIVALALVLWVAL
uniref:Flavin-containing monooxygenase n=1 Tax=Eptatretus burgeri TaxID=7764 RepID=A0A8C4PZQ1_EPTBU